MKETDLASLLESSGIATILLDSRLEIRDFTPAAARIFAIGPSDLGRPISALASRLDLPPLADDVAATLAGDLPRDRRVRVRDAATRYLMRMTPCRIGTPETTGVALHFIDVTALSEAEDRQRLLIAELQHRTRNLLAVVRAISGQTLATSVTLAEFESKFAARLGALARVQSLLSSAEADPVTVGALVRMELDAVDAGNARERVRLNGPEVPLAPAIVRDLALTLHELATNALKHGALASPSGLLDVSWKIEHADGERLRLDWRETLDPPLPLEKPARVGFGRELIELALPYQLGADTDYRLTPEGVRCVLHIPLQHGSE